MNTTKIQALQEEIRAISLQDLDLGQEFEIGDEVWSNADEKKKEMLIKIVDKKITKLNKRVIYKCEYIDKEYLNKLGWKKKYFYNTGRFLRSQVFPYGLTTIFEDKLKAKLSQAQEDLAIAEKFESELKGEYEKMILDFLKKFDEYSCIKNDKWYLDFKEEIIDNLTKKDYSKEELQ